MKLKSFKMNRMFFFVVLVLVGLFLAYFMLTSKKEGFQAQGSWDRSCKNEIEDTTNYLLTAKCKNMNGKYTQNNNFNYKNCPNYQVTNNAGKLKCGP